jgi:hypothetical protein
MISRRFVVVATCLASMLLACSDDGAPDATVVTATVASTSPSAPPTEAGSDSVPVTDATSSATSSTTADQLIEISTPPGGTGDFVGARADVSELTCEPTETGWTASGVVTNPTDAPAAYRIYVSFLDRSGTTLGVIEVGVGDVGPGEARQWSTDAAIAVDGLDCVLRVEREAA